MFLHTNKLRGGQLQLVYNGIFFFFFNKSFICFLYINDSCRCYRLSLKSLWIKWCPRTLHAQHKTFQGTNPSRHTVTGPSREHVVFNILFIHPVIYSSVNTEPITQNPMFEKNVYLALQWAHSLTSQWMLNFLWWHKFWRWKPKHWKKKQECFIRMG